MTALHPPETTRKRAPSKRALATRERVLNAAERVFAQRGFDGATIRDIAAEAHEPVGTVHHHGGCKSLLFEQCVTRRASVLADRRMDALSQAKRVAPLTLDAVLGAFMYPFFDLRQEDPRWQDYARLVAFVSSEARWQPLCATCFDPTAQDFVAHIQALSPEKSPAACAAGFVFCVSSMLALLTSHPRIETLGCKSAQTARIKHLIQFCAAGLAHGQ